MFQARRQLVYGILSAIICSLASRVVDDRKNTINFSVVRNK